MCNERSDWSHTDVRTFFVSLCQFNVTWVKARTAGRPLDLSRPWRCFDFVVIASTSIVRHHSVPYVEWIGFLRVWQSFYTTTRGATPRLVVLIRDDVLRLSHLVVMPHLIGCAPPPSPGARIGAGIELWVVGTAVVVCWPATWWRTSCGNRAISCLKFRKMFDNETKYMYIYIFIYDRKKHSGTKLPVAHTCVCTR